MRRMNNWGRFPQSCLAQGEAFLQLAGSVHLAQLVVPQRRLREAPLGVQDARVACLELQLQRVVLSGVGGGGWRGTGPRAGVGQLRLYRGGKTAMRVRCAVCVGLLPRPTVMTSR